MHFALKLTLVATILSMGGFAQSTGSSTMSETQEVTRLKVWKDPYRWSVTAVSLATAADLASSFKFSADGQKEANPLLRNSSGGYSGKGAAIEAAAVGGSLLLQHYVVRRHPNLKMPFMIANYALAGFQVYNVKHNVSY